MYIRIQRGVLIMRICGKCKYHTTLYELRICPECGNLLDDYPTEGMKRLMKGEQQWYAIIVEAGNVKATNTTNTAEHVASQNTTPHDQDD